jgi:hypothetical protein
VDDHGVVHASSTSGLRAAAGSGYNDYMAKSLIVGSRELRTRLGQYLNRVRRGETILVTDDQASSMTQRDRAAAAFVSDLMAWHVVELTPDVLATARRLLMHHQLRAGDAVQLSSALVLQVGPEEVLEEFVAYDQRVLGVADAEQLAVRTK